MHTWRCTKPKKPIMKGVIGSMSVVDGDEPNTSFVLFKAHMHLVIPVCLVAKLLSKKFPEIMRPLEEEYARRGEEMYDGPQPPPAATEEQQPGLVPISDVPGKSAGQSGARVLPHD